MFSPVVSMTSQSKDGRKQCSDRYRRTCRQFMRLESAEVFCKHRTRCTFNL